MNTVTSDQIRVAIVENHELMRESLWRCLGREPDIDLVGSAEDGDDAITLCDDLVESGTGIDVVLMDYRMNRVSGPEACERILEHHPEIKIVFLTEYAERFRVHQALRAGASGYLLKEHATSRNLADKIRQVMSTEAVFDEGSTRVLLDFASPSSPPDASRLTPREKEVLELIRVGMTNAEIAAELKVSRETVKSHADNIYDKLEVGNRQAAVTKAVELGLLDALP
ncbi:MAG: DNA-binding response regulator [Actinobacteria bacterium ATB1]|nr:DNA-binding response regulator [Actinobacteria bacterium ATB1]